MKLIDQQISRASCLSCARVNSVPQPYHREPRNHSLIFPCVDVSVNMSGSFHVLSKSQCHKKQCDTTRAQQKEEEENEIKNFAHVCMVASESHLVCLVQSKLEDSRACVMLTVLLVVPVGLMPLKGSSWAKWLQCKRKTSTRIRNEPPPSVRKCYCKNYAQRCLCCLCLFCSRSRTTVSH